MPFVLQVRDERNATVVEQELGVPATDRHPRISVMRGESELVAFDLVCHDHGSTPLGKVGLGFPGARAFAPRYASTTL